MKFLVAILAVALGLTGVATAANTLALVIDPTDLETGFWYDYCGPATLHLVVLDPYNPVADRPVGTIGGFECRIVLPPEVLLIDLRLPPASFSFTAWPDLLVGTSVPVAAGHAVLATLDVLVPDDLAQTAYAYLEPVNPHDQSIPDALAVTDADDAFRLIEAAPVSGSFAEPVFRFGVAWPIWPLPGGDYPETGCIVPNGHRSWGAVKSLYR